LIKTVFYLRHPDWSHVFPGIICQSCHYPASRVHFKNIYETIRKHRGLMNRALYAVPQENMTEDIQPGPLSRLESIYWLYLV